MAGPHLAVSLVLPCTSCTKWQSTQCMPFSRWMSMQCTGTPFVCVERTLRRDRCRRHRSGRLRAVPWPARRSIAACSWSTSARRRCPCMIEQVALAVLLEHGAEHPAVAVEVGELRVSRRPDSGRSRFPGTRGSDQMPLAAASSGWSSALDQLARRSDASAGRVHQLAVGLLVPPHVAEVAVHDVRAGVDVADDALAGRDAGGELCSIGWPGSSLGMVGSGRVAGSAAVAVDLA